LTGDSFKTRANQNGQMSQKKRASQVSWYISKHE